MFYNPSTSIKINLPLKQLVLSEKIKLRAEENDFLLKYLVKVLDLFFLETIVSQFEFRMKAFDWWSNPKSIISIRDEVSTIVSQKPVLQVA